MERNSVCKMMLFALALMFWFALSAADSINTVLADQARNVDLESMERTLDHALAGMKAIQTHPTTLPTLCQAWAMAMGTTPKSFSSSR